MKENQPGKTTAERVVIALLICTNLVTAGFYFYELYSHDHDINAYPLIDVSRHIIPQENFIVNIQPLREELNRMSTEFGEGSLSLYVEFLNTGANISVGKDNYIWPVSLAKLPLAIAVMKKVETGEWTLANELVLLENDRNAKSGDSKDPLLEFPIGTRFTIEKLLEELLVNSDNTAYNILLRNMHNDDIEVVIEELGLEELFTPDGKVSAKEYSRIFRSLYTSSFLKRANSQMILTWLDASTFNDFLAQSVPENIPFPHKYGENLSLGVYADSGIVYVPGRPYMISVMIKMPGTGTPNSTETARAREFMRQVSGAAYTYFSAVK